MNDQGSQPASQLRGDGSIGTISSGAVAMLVGLIALLTMCRLCAYDFIDWDDSSTIYHNPRLNPPTGEALQFYWKHGEYGLYIPGTYTIWCGLAKIARMAEPDARGIQLNAHVFHTANVLLHAAAAVVVFLLLRR